VQQGSFFFSNFSLVFGTLTVLTSDWFDCFDLLCLLDLLDLRNLRIDAMYGGDTT